MSGDSVCEVQAPLGTPGASVAGINVEPACAYQIGHRGPHSWAAPDPATPVDAVTEAWPVLDAVRHERQRHEIELACKAEGHAYFRDGADPIHGVCGFCACGSELYNIADGSPLT